MLIEDTIGLHATLSAYLYDADTSKGMFSYYRKSMLDDKEQSIKESSKSMREFYAKRYQSDSTKLESERKNKREAQEILDNAIRKLEDKTHTLQIMTEEERNSVGYYRVYHGCHANNSYGGQVLKE